MREQFGVAAPAVAKRQAEEAAGEIAATWRRIAGALMVASASDDALRGYLRNPCERHERAFDARRSRLLAKRWNEFRNRSATVCLTIGTAMIGGSVVVLTSEAPRDGAYYWPIVGAALIGLSLTLPFFLESEET